MKQTNHFDMHLTQGKYTNFHIKKQLNGTWLLRVSKAQQVLQYHQKELLTLAQPQFKTSRILKTIYILMSAVNRKCSKVLHTFYSLGVFNYHNSILSKDMQSSTVDM